MLILFNLFLYLASLVLISGLFLGNSFTFINILFGVMGLLVFYSAIQITKVIK